MSPEVFRRVTGVIVRGEFRDILQQINPDMTALTRLFVVKYPLLKGQRSFSTGLQCL